MTRKPDNRLYLPLALLVVLLSLVANHWLSQPPPLVAATAPRAEFSGERAMNLLRAFLEEGVAHPVGSPENQRVKQRIQNWLNAQGIAQEEQAAWACDQGWKASCGFVENIIATIPGREAGPYVALMAHYDSVPASPGAGDDMAGVVAVLETARAIMARGSTRLPILLLLTDGEETGLHGAHAFFSRHPLATEVAVVLNVEGSGTRGPSNLLRTSASNRSLMDSLAASQRYARGSSMAAEVFSRMPNDTDFSVPLKAGIPGIDFSFAAERVHYHTPNDRPELLDPRTIQHHGENLLPLTLDLANGRRSAKSASGGEDSVVFQDLFGRWLQWPTSWNWYLMAATGVLLLAASRRREVATGRLFFAATLIPVLAIAASVGAGYGALQGLDRFHGATVDWPAQLWAFRLTVVGAAVFGGCLFAALIPSRFTASLLLLGVWWFYGIFVALLMVFLSAAAGAYLVPLIPAVLLLSVAVWLPLPDVLRRLCLVATLVPAVLLLSTARQLEEALGYQLVLAPLAMLGLYMALALPFLRGPWLLLLSLGSILAIAVGAIGATWLPLYSEYRPQHVNVRHLEDADARVAHWRVSTGHDIPAPMRAILEFDTSLLQLYPWSSETYEHTAPAQYRSLPAPQVAILSDVRSAESRELTLRLTSQRKAWSLGLFIPAGAGLESLQIDGASLEFAAAKQSGDDSFTPIYLYGMPDQVAELRLVVGAGEPVEAYLADYATTLPVAGVVNARPANSSQVHNGDLSVVWRKFSF